MTNMKPETKVKRAFARASRRMCQTVKPLHPKRRQPVRTIWTVNRLLEAWRDPREVLLEIASMDTNQLAELARCSPLEALQERRLCAQAVLPYVAQKLPVQVDMRHTRAIHLNIVTDDQYQELVNVAQEPGDGAQSVSVQLVNGLGAESTTDETAGDETGVRPAVPATPSGDNGADDAHKR
jgi:hypothetical protein